MSTPHVNVLRSVDESGVNYTIHDHASFDTPIKSPQDFAGALGYPLRRITKTVFLRSKSAEERFAAVVCGMDRKLDFTAISEALQPPARMEVARAEELDRIASYPAHGVSPLGLPAGVDVLVDEALLGEETILVGGGTVGVELELSPADLVWTASARVAQICAT